MCDAEDALDELQRKYDALVAESEVGKKESVPTMTPYEKTQLTIDSSHCIVYGTIEELKRVLEWTETIDVPRTQQFGLSLIRDIPALMYSAVRIEAWHTKNFPKTAVLVITDDDAGVVIAPRIVED